MNIKKIKTLFKSITKTNDYKDMYEKEVLAKKASEDALKSLRSQLKAILDESNKKTEFNGRGM